LTFFQRSSSGGTLSLQCRELFSFDRLRALLATGANAKQATEAAQRFFQDDDITVLTFTRDSGSDQRARCFTTARLTGIGCAI
jgi:hypothetical protein